MLVILKRSNGKELAVRPQHVVAIESRASGCHIRLVGGFTYDVAMNLDDLVKTLNE